MKKTEVRREQCVAFGKTKKGASKKGLVNSGIIARVNHACGFGNTEGIPMILPILKSSTLIF